MPLISAPGFNYKFAPAACGKCPGRCCNGAPGNVFVDEAEIRAIAAFLGLQKQEFIARCLETRAGRPAIKETRQAGNYACMFFDGQRNRCSIYPVRPDQCRTFPFWEHYRSRPDELHAECPGVVFEKRDETAAQNA